MDIKNTLLGLFFIAAGIIVIFLQTKEIDQIKQQNGNESANKLEESFSDGSNDSGNFDQLISTTSLDNIDGQQNALFSQEESSSLKPYVSLGLSEADSYTISNEFIEVSLTTKGGGISQVRFLKTKRGNADTYVFNSDVDLPAYSLSFKDVNRMVPLNANFTIQENNEDSVSFVFRDSHGLVVRRSYSLSDSEEEPYLIKHSTAILNESDGLKTIKPIYMNLGTSFPINEKESSQYLSVGTFNGDKAKFTTIDKVKNYKFANGKEFLDSDSVLSKRDRFDWVSLQNQYYVSLFSASSMSVRDAQIFPVEVATQQKLGISCNVGFEIDKVGPGETKTIDTEFYIGPKEFKRIQDLGNNKDRVMQFGWFGFFSKLLLYFMSSINAFVGNWGASIVIMTIIIKFIFWPLTAKAAESQKGMSKIQEPMAELKAKYANSPQKLQQETLKLFKEHGVNPLAGCFPILIQMPIFIGLFFMLRTAAELRYESFLWVKDLSQPDTIYELSFLGGFPINIFPILMGITMFFQMRITPISPNADAFQQKLFKFLPFIFLVFLYNFSSGLVIYWTTQNLLTIIQTKIIHNRKEPILINDSKVKKARKINAKVKSSKKNFRN